MIRKLKFSISDIENLDINEIKLYLSQSSRNDFRDIEESRLRLMLMGKLSSYDLLDTEINDMTEFRSMYLINETKLKEYANMFEIPYTDKLLTIYIILFHHNLIKRPELFDIFDNRLNDDHYRILSISGQHPLMISYYTYKEQSTQ